MTRPLMIDLCSGIGGFSLAGHWAGYQTVAFAEPDKFCQEVLRKNFGNEAKIYDYARQVTTDALGYRPGDIRLITAGFPCQPFSVAGKQRGKEDDRFIWHEISSVIKDFQPALFVGENVTGIVGMALDDVLDDLESHGYATQAYIIPAASVGAPHKRDRVWITAKRLATDPDSKQRHERQYASIGNQAGFISSGVNEAANVTDADRERRSKCNVPARRPAMGFATGRNNEADATNAYSAKCQTRHSYGLGENQPTRTFTCPGRDASHAANERLQSAGRTRDGQPRPTHDDGRIPVRRLCAMDDGLSAGLDGFTNYWQHNAMPQPIDHERRRDRANRLKALGNAIVPQVAYRVIKSLEECEV